MIRIAAAGDVHFDKNSEGKLRNHFQNLENRADFFLLAGDLTQRGHIEEAQVLADDLRHCPIPVIATLGNHDYHLNQVDQVISILREAGVQVLERNTISMAFRGVTVGIVGLKGFGGGFLGACASEFGEPEMKEFIGHTREQADYLRKTLQEMQTEYKVVLLHYSPISETVLGEKREIYPFLGSYLLAEAIDSAGADIVFHGHAHKGIERGSTQTGVPVRNVALPVIRHAFNIYTIDKEGVYHQPHSDSHSAMIEL
jgi:Icc-related predicted phosphoesterase